MAQLGSRGALQESIASAIANADADVAGLQAQIVAATNSITTQSGQIATALADVQIAQNEAQQATADAQAAAAALLAADYLDRDLSNGASTVAMPTAFRDSLRTGLGLGALAYLATVGNSQLAAGALTLAKFAASTANTVMGFDAAGAPYAYPAGPLAERQVTVIGKGRGGAVRTFVTNKNAVYAVGASAQNGFTAQTSLARRVLFLTEPTWPIVQVIEGAASTFFIDTAGDVFAMGNNAQGQLGLGNTTASSVAIKVAAVSDVIAVAATGDGGGTNNSTFFLQSDGTLFAAGDNTYGQLGLGDTTQRNTATEVTAVTGVTSIVIGANNGPHAAAIASGALWMTGRNANGQLGLGDTTQRTTFTQVGSITNASKAVVSSSGSTLPGCTHLRKVDGTLWATGYNANGQLGLSDTTQRTAFTQVGSATTWLDVVSNGDGWGTVVAAVNALGELWVWGYNNSGVCGSGNTTNQGAPQKPAGAFQGDVVEVHLGGRDASTFCAALTSAGELWTCGYGIGGALADGTSTNRNTFAEAAVIGGSINDIAVSASGTAAGLTVRYTNGRCAVCGPAASGQTGFGDTSTVRYLYDINLPPVQ